MTTAFAALLSSVLTLVVVKLSRLRTSRSSVFNDRILWAFPVLFFLAIGAVAGGMVIGERLLAGQCAALALERAGRLIPALQDLQGLTRRLSPPTSAGER